MEKFKGLQFYRCVLCGTPVSVWNIKDGTGCPKCGNRRIKSTNLTIKEMIREIIRHPKVWEWKNVKL